MQILRSEKKMNFVAWAIKIKKRGGVERLSCMKSVSCSKLSMSDVTTTKFRLRSKDLIYRDILIDICMYILYFLNRLL